jgi:hypothetical protein
VLVLYFNLLAVCCLLLRLYFEKKIEPTALAAGCWLLAEQN